MPFIRVAMGVPKFACDANRSVYASRCKRRIAMIYLSSPSRIIIVVVGPSIHPRSPLPLLVTPAWLFVSARIERVRRDYSI